MESTDLLKEGYYAEEVEEYALAGLEEYTSEWKLKLLNEGK